MATEIKKSFNTFLKQSIVLAAVLLVVHFVLIMQFPELQYSPARPWIILFFLLITNFIYYYQLKATGSKGSKFVNIFLVTTGFKFLFFLAVIVIYALMFRSDAVAFITDFFIVYLFFTGMEVIRIKKFQQAK